ncbi:MAG: C40 family peptidase [Candidatus Eremiobacteraeota bacterium]|nr:C40 family peptidase [Candidatus Eremiobacteraeota bacterium]
MAEARMHVVSSGETLQSIARQEHVSVADIARFNDLQGRVDGPLAAGRILVLDEESATALTVAALPPASTPPLDESANPLLQPSPADTVTQTPHQLSDFWRASSPALRGPASPVRRFAGRILTRASRLALRLTRSAMRFIGTPYVFGGTGIYGFDCSGYVQHVFALLGIHLPRTADSQYYAGRSTGGRILAGDLVFFQTYEAGPSHVGIYLGKGRFVHASSSHGVEVSNLREGYWAARYIGAKRYVTPSRTSALVKTAIAIN